MLKYILLCIIVIYIVRKRFFIKQKLLELLGISNNIPIAVCPVCGNSIYEHKDKYKCIKCSFDMPKEFSGYNFSELGIKNLLSSGKISLPIEKNVDDKYIEKTISFNKKSGLQEQISSFDVLGKCPVCGNDVIAIYNGYRCVSGVISTEHKCNFGLSDKINDHLLSKEDVVALLDFDVTSIYSKINEFGYNTFYDLKLGDNNKPVYRILKKVVGKCPICGGDFIEDEQSYCCENKNTEESARCIAIIPKTIGKVWETSEDYILSKDDIINLLAGKPTDKHNLLNNKGQVCMVSFIIDAKSGFKVYSSEAFVIGKCPDCGGDVYVGENRYYCSKCKWWFSRIVKSAEIDEHNIRLILQGEKTDILDFVWDNGNSGLARLYWQNGKLKWDFY